MQWRHKISKHNKRRQHNFNRKTVDKYLEKVYENAQLEERLHEIIESSSFKEEEKELAKELDIQKKRS